MQGYVFDETRFTLRYIMCQSICFFSRGNVGLHPTGAEDTYQSGDYQRRGAGNQQRLAQVLAGAQMREVEPCVWVKYARKLAYQGGREGVARKRALLKREGVIL